MLKFGKLGVRMFSSTSPVSNELLKINYKPKLYADVNVNKPDEYYNFEKTELKLG